MKQWLWKYASFLCNALRGSWSPRRDQSTPHVELYEFPQPEITTQSSSKYIQIIIINNNNLNDDDC